MSSNRAEAGWQQLKNEYGANYRYVANGGSVFGPTYETTLTVQNDKIVQRDLSIVEIDGDTGETTVTESWSETGDAVGSHENSGAAETITVDTRFQSCKQALDKPDIGTHEVYLLYIAPLNVAPREEVVLASCDVIPPGLVQDGGESLTELEFLPQTN